MVPEAPLEKTENGLVPSGEGWFVLNARDARWWYVAGRGGFCDFEGEQDWTQLGVNISRLAPNEAMAMYHWEADQEDFLVVYGEALLIVEGEERPLRQWDFVHCPPDTKHTIVGAGEDGCVVVAVGAREHQNRPGWGGYTRRRGRDAPRRGRREGDDGAGRGLRGRPRALRLARACLRIRRAGSPS